jgi:ADP-ribose pyrophosphatase YjhB (NUDIX family)
VNRKRGDRRRYPERPILGVGALILRRDSILLVERGRPPLKGYWSLPGGALEAGEQLADALRREVLEETGLEVKPLSVVEIFERILRDTEGKAEYHYVVIDYLCKVSGGELKPADDATQAAWVKRRDLSAYRITEGTLEVIERAFERRDSFKSV